MLSAATVTVTALPEKGVLPVEFRTNRKLKRSQPYVLKNHVEAFLNGHRSLRSLARGWGLNVVSMKEKLDRNGVAPIFETSGFIARYYQKEDLARASLLPPTS